MIVFDESQEKVISANGGYYLVLAPPGCGKTELLTHRIINAHSEYGIEYSDMLCLTFTNRAARGMRDRVNENAPESSDDLYVGNIHRFCSRFLYDNQIVPMATGIIDELDQQDILDEYGFTRYNNSHEGFANQLQVGDIGRLASRLYQEEHNHPKDVWLDLPSFITEEEREKMLQRITSEGVWQPSNGDEEKKMRSLLMAQSYYDFKLLYNVIDFDDILLYSYTRMMESDYKDLLYSDYHWIQIDEVQDLNNLQFAIIDKLTAKEGFTVMYLGDEQQAIYSFMGAKLKNLEMLAHRAGGNILRLYTNYRSPKYLLDAFNTYAIEQLKLDERLLPQPNNKDEASKGTMNIFSYHDSDKQDEGLVKIIKVVTQKFPEERVGVLVRTNKSADRVSKALDVEGIPHFKISGQDVFKTNEYKTLVAHFSVVQQDTNFLEWARILWMLKATQSFKDARALVAKLRVAAVSPLDLIDYGGDSSYVAEFLEIYENKELVIFDTETTGLNIFEDDIIQIAAVKVRNGKIVPGSEFNILIRTDRDIPLVLGKEINPMIEVYNNGPLSEAEDALRAFLDYVGDDEILGHNVNYDYQILRYNLLRRLGGERIEDHISNYWDSLKVIRLVEPKLRVYKLKNLLKVLGLEGENTHRADDDVMATNSVVRYCVSRIYEKMALQEKLWRDVNVRNAANRLKDNYGALYAQTRGVLFENSSHQFIDEFEVVYSFLINNNYFKPIQNFEYIVSFFRNNVFNISEEKFLWQQLNSHLSDLKSFSQADLCESGIINEKVYLMTVHKAKGLEFEHVILYDAVDGNYPFFLSHTPDQQMEDARVFYVGISRAKKRLSILYPATVVNRYGRIFPKRLTPFMECIKNRFIFYP